MNNALLCDTHILTTCLQDPALNQKQHLKDPQHKYIGDISKGYSYSICKRKKCIRNSEMLCMSSFKMLTIYRPLSKSKIYQPEKILRIILYYNRNMGHSLRYRFCIYIYVYIDKHAYLKMYIYIYICIYIFLFCFIYVCICICVCH